MVGEEFVELRKQGSFIVTAKDLQNIQKFGDNEISEWFKPNYIAIGFIILAALFMLYIAFRFYKWYTKKPLQPLDIALNHLNKKECLEYLKLKKEIDQYEQELQESIEQLRESNNIIRVGNRPGNINMANYTVVTPTDPIPSTL